MHLKDINKSNDIITEITTANIIRITLSTQVTVSGPGLEKTVVTVTKWAEFTIDARKAGKAPVHVAAMDADCNPIDVVMKDNKDGTFFCRYMPKRPIKHTIIISYDGVSIPNSPYRVSTV